MEIGFKIWLGISTVLGAICIGGFTLWLTGHAFVGLLKMLRVWHILALATGIAFRGKDYRESLFWNAIKERSQASGFEAMQIAAFATKHAKDDGGEI